MLHSVMKSLVDTENMNLNASFFHNNNKYLLTGYLQCARGFPGGSDSKESACNVGDPGLIPGLGRSPGEENGCPLQYSCLENSMNRGVWQATVHRVAESDTTER